jgi:hypothetical protein
MEEWLPPSQLSSSVGGVDMDGTLFENDLGIDVFLERLIKTNFWRAFDNNGFARLLLPRRYEEKLLSGAAGKIPELPPDTCHHALNLWKDIVDLHRALRNLIDTSQVHSPDINHPLVNEFARKMLAFDQTLMNLDSYFLKIFHGQLLMRVRFFAGRSNSLTRTMTERIIKRRRRARFVNLRIHPENQRLVSQRVKENMLPPIRYDRLIRVIEGTRVFLKKVLEGGAHPAIITTNLEDIADAFIRFPDSPYHFLCTRGQPRVYGTKLETNGHSGKSQVFRSRINGMPVFGPQKAQIAEQFSQRENRPFLFAAGDSLRSDGPMGQLALKNSGVFLAVGKDYETMRRQFHQLYKRALGKGVQHLEERIWYYETQ